MAKTSYTVDDVDALMKAKPFLQKTETEKYAIYKSVDPFPWIGAALLNSADLLKYILTVGIIEPFEVTNLKGVTYQCTFSGEAHRFDPEIGGMEEIRLNDNEELVLEKNSITYLKIKEKIRVPEYMVLRFNLSVSNAYKGLLLGTGPIIDPGFDGNLFIPLHNLTGNEYIIKKGAPLIRVEFTKLSRHPVWGRKNAGVFPSLEPITKETPSYASFSKSIEGALLDSDKKQFYTRGDVISVRSSIPDAIRTSAEKAEEAQKSAKAAKNWTFAGAMGVLIALTAVVISVYSLIQDTSTRFDSMVKEIGTCKQQIDTLTQQLEETQERLELYEVVYSSAPEQELNPEISSEINSLPFLPSDEVDEGENDKLRPEQ